MDVNNISFRQFQKHIIFFIPTIIVLLYLWIGFSSNEEVYSTFKTLNQSNPSLTRTISFFSRWANYCIYPAYVVILVIGISRGDSQKKNFILAFIISFLCTSLLVYGCKIAFGHPRPRYPGPPIPFSLDADYHSFPSGYSFRSVFLLMPFANFLKGNVLVLAMGCFPALMIYSRVYLNKHHFADVLGGAVVGYLGSLLLGMIWFRLNARSERVDNYPFGMASVELPATATRD